MKTALLLRLRIIFAACIVFLLLATPGLAHKVNIFAYVADDVVYTESYFPDGSPVKNGQVEVRQGEQLLVTGKTDSDGYFNFPQPSGSELKIIVDAEMGHKNHFRLDLNQP